MPKPRREKPSTASAAESRETSINELGAGAEQVERKGKNAKVISLEERREKAKALKRQKTEVAAEEEAEVAKIKKEIAMPEGEIRRLEKRAAETFEDYKKAKDTAERAEAEFLQKTGRVDSPMTFAEANRVKNLRQVAAHEKKRADLVERAALQARVRADRLEEEKTPELSYGEGELTEAEEGAVGLDQMQKQARSEYKKAEKQSQNLEDAFRRMYGDELAEYSLGIEKAGAMTKLGRGLADLVRRGAATLSGEPYKSRQAFAKEFRDLSSKMDEWKLTGYGQELGAASKVAFEGVTGKAHKRAVAERNLPAGEERAKQATEREEARAFRGKMGMIKEQELAQASEIAQGEPEAQEALFFPGGKTIEQYATPKQRRGKREQPARTEEAVEDLSEYAMEEPTPPAVEKVPENATRFYEENQERINTIRDRILPGGEAHALYNVAQESMMKKDKARAATKLLGIEPATKYVLLVAERQEALDRMNQATKAAEIDRLAKQVDALAARIEKANVAIGLDPELTLTTPFNFKNPERKREAA